MWNNAMESATGNAQAFPDPLVPPPSQGTLSYVKYSLQNAVDITERLESRASHLADRIAGSESGLKAGGKEQLKTVACGEISEMSDILTTLFVRLAALDHSLDRINCAL